MATVRELITKIKFAVDTSGLDKAKNATDELKKKSKAAGDEAEKNLGKTATAANKAGNATSKATSIMSRLRGALSSINSRSLDSTATAANRTADSLNRVTTAANRAGNATSKAATVAGTTWRQLAAIIAGANIIDTANDTMNLDNRLRVIQQDNAKRAQLKKSLYDIGQDARADYLSLGDLFFKVRQSGAAYGIDDKQGLEITEIVSKALTTGGASTAEKNATILQLGQALGSGVLQGDELRSLKENAGQLMQYMADEMGVTVGQLKDMGAKGELSTEQVTKAILAAGKKVRADFALSTQTIGQSWERVKNSFKYSIDIIESETHIFSRTANGISTALDYATNGVKVIKKLWEGDSETAKQHPQLKALIDGAKTAYDELSKVYGIIKKVGKSFFIKFKYKRAKLKGEPITPELEQQYRATLPQEGFSLGTGLDDQLEKINTYLENVSGFAAKVQALFEGLGKGIKDSLSPLTDGEFTAVWQYVQGQIESGLEKLGISWSNLGNGIEAITPLLQVIAQVVGTVIVKAVEGLLVVGSWVFNGLATLIMWVTDLINLFAEAVKVCANELAYLIDLAKQALQYLGLVNTASSGMDNLATKNMVDGWLGNKSVKVVNNISQENHFPPFSETTIPKVVKNSYPEFPTLSYGLFG